MESGVNGTALTSQDRGGCLTHVHAGNVLGTAPGTQRAFYARNAHVLAVIGNLLLFCDVSVWL